jgi:hypothetical protein
MHLTDSEAIEAKLKLGEFVEKGSFAHASSLLLSTHTVPSNWTAS